MPRSLTLFACAMIALLPLLGTPAPAQTVAPPAPPVEAAPLPPPVVAGTYWVWRPGYWRWNGFRYVCLRGRYVRAPYPQAAWIPGAWVFVNGQYVWHNGHWQR